MLQLKKKILRSIQNFTIHAYNTIHRKIKQLKLNVNTQTFNCFRCIETSINATIL